MKEENEIQKGRNTGRKKLFLKKEIASMNIRVRNARGATTVFAE